MTGVRTALLPKYKADIVSRVSTNCFKITNKSGRKLKELVTVSES